MAARTTRAPETGQSRERHGADGREALFDRLYDEHRQALHAFFLGKTSDPELALDLLQEAFVRVWRNLDVLQALPAARQRAWIFTAARNLVIDQYRGRAARSTAHDALIAAVERDPPVSSDPEQIVEQDQELRLLDQAIRRLPETLRTVLVLHVLGERSSAEMGELLDRPAGTVRYQLSQARKRLAEELRLLDETPTREAPALTPPAPSPASRRGGADPIVVEV